MNEKEFIYWLAGILDANPGNNFITEKTIGLIRKKVSHFVQLEEVIEKPRATVQTHNGPKTVWDEGKY